MLHFILSYFFMLLLTFTKNIKQKGSYRTRGVQFIILQKAHYHILFVNLLKSQNPQTVEFKNEDYLMHNQRMEIFRKIFENFW